MFQKRILAALCVAALLSAPVPFALAQEDALTEPSITEQGGLVTDENGMVQEPTRPEVQPLPTVTGEIPGAEPRKPPPPRDHSYVQPDDLPGASIPHLTTNDFLSRVGNSELPVLVQFDASWCPFCKKLQPMLDDLRDKKLGKLEVYKVDADAEGDLMRSYEVGTLPTLIMFYNGTIVGRSDGGLEKKELHDWVEAVEDDIKSMQRKAGGPRRL